MLFVALKAQLLISTRPAILGEEVTIFGDADHDYEPESESDAETPGISKWIEIVYLKPW